MGDLAEQAGPAQRLLGGHAQQHAVESADVTVFEDLQGELLQLGEARFVRGGALGIGAGTVSGLASPPMAGVVRVGSPGVTIPRILTEARPQYTSDALRAKIQGSVVVECVVQTDGTVGDVRVIRSLDTTYGLDQEAIKAAKQWKFAPGTRNGEPVPVMVSIELTFTLGKD